MGLQHRKQKGNNSTNRKSRKQVRTMGRGIKVGTTKGGKNKTGKGAALSAKRSTPLPKLLAKAQQVFNRYIRTRDSEDGCFQCISCGNIHPTELMDAGHYVPVKGGSFLRYHEWNTNGECKKCNGFDEFHLIGYRKRLVDKIGEDAVKWLEENRHTVKKWTRSELEEIINKYSV